MGQLRKASETLIFQHIPKTAGTTISFILTRYFEEQDIYHIRNLQQMRGPAYSKHFGSIENFIDLDPNERNRFNCIIGHAPFGLHRHLNHHANYITFIRDPVKRVISQYHQHQRMIKTNELDDEQLTLEQFLERKPVPYDNFQTRYISGLDRNSSTPEERFEKAITNIDQHFSLVGIVERFDESLLLLSKMFCWPDITYTKRNTTARKDSLVSIDPATIQQIRDANQFDAKLYQYAVARLDEKIRLQEAAFSDELKAFKRKQTVATKLHKGIALAHGLARRLIHVGRSLNP